MNGTISQLKRWSQETKLPNPNVLFSKWAILNLSSWAKMGGFSTRAKAVAMPNMVRTIEERLPRICCFQLKNHGLDSCLDRADEGPSDRDGRFPVSDSSTMAGAAMVTGACRGVGGRNLALSSLWKQNEDGSLWLRLLEKDRNEAQSMQVKCLCC